MKFSLLVTALVSSFVLCSGSYGWGNVYTKGRYTCDFAEIEKLYKSEPQDIGYKVGYGACLALTGNSADGLSRLRRIAKQNNHVFAVLFVTEYVETDGRFQAPIDFDNINEAIFGYGQVLAYVNWEGNSYPQSEPIDYTIYERSNQMELRAYYRIPHLYKSKFHLGFYGTYHRYLSYGQIWCMAVLNPAALLPVSFSSTPSTNLTSAITSAR